MKSWNAEERMQSRKVSRLGLLSLLSLMALVLSVGGIAVAEQSKGLKLYHKVDRDWKKFETITDAQKKEAYKWLVEEPDFTKYVKTFKSHPEVYVRGFISAMVEAKKNGKSADEVKTLAQFTRDRLKEVSRTDFGSVSKRKAFTSLIEDLTEMSLEEMEKLSDKDLEEMFLDRSVKEALNILTEEEFKKRQQEEADKNKGKGEGEAKGEGKGDGTPKGEAKGDGTPKGEGKGEGTLAAGAPTGNQQQVAPPQPVVNPNLGASAVGEDAGLKAAAQGICDQINKRNKDQVDALQELLNGLNALSRNRRERDRKDDGLGALANLLANANQDRGQQAVTPPAAPPAVAARPNTSKEQPFDNNPLPPPYQEPQPQAGAPFMPPTQNMATTAKPITLDLPTASGRGELRAAKDLLARNEMETSELAKIRMNSPIEQMFLAQSRANSKLQRTQATLARVSNKLDGLESIIEERKQGGRDLLPSWVKKETARLEQEVKNRESALEQNKQTAMQFAQNAPEEVKQGLGQMLSQMAQEVQRAKNEKAQFDAEVESKVEEGDRELKRLAKVRDSLAAAKSELESQAKQYKEESEGIAGLINKRTEMDIAQITGGQQPYGAPNVRNGARLQQFGGAGGRTVPSSRIGIGSAQQQTVSGGTGEIRGPLRGTGVPKLQ